MPGLLFLVFAVAALAQDKPELDLLRGEFLEADGLEFALRADDHRVHRFRVDDKTFIEREEERVKLLNLAAGDMVDVVTDRTVPPAGARYARLVKVVKAKLITSQGANPSARWRFSDYPSSLLLSRGSQTFSGVVTKIRDSRLVLRTRKGEERLFHIRNDTVYRGDGRPAKAADLVMQTPVFVRAGRTFENELVAYEIVWGAILKPDGVR